MMALGDSFLKYIGTATHGVATLSIWPGSLDFKLGLPRMGLSSVPNSHREDRHGGTNTFDETSLDYCGERFQPSPPPHLKKGRHGITAHGKRMVRSAAAILQERHGHKNLTFGTLTLPALSQEQLLLVSHKWSELKRQWSQELSRLLKRKGLDPDWVDVTEVQANRWKKRQEVALHLHYLHQGKRRGEHWAIAPSEIRDIWQRLLSNLLGVEVDCSAATRIESVKLNAAHYLGKYMSKGGKVVNSIKDKNCEDFLPSTWYGVSAHLRREIKAGITTLSSDRTWWFWCHLDALLTMGVVEWSFEIYQLRGNNPDPLVSEVCVGSVGSIRADVRSLRFITGEFNLYDYENWYCSDEYWANQDVA